MKVTNSAEKVIEDLLLANYDKYYRMAYSYVRNEQDALDIVQEAAYKAIKDSKKIKDISYAETWIYRVVINTALDFLRKHKKEVALPEYEEGEYHDKYEDFDVMKSLNKLGKQEQTIVILRFFEDKKLEDIAEVLQENTSTVKTKLYRALKKLRVDLDYEKNRSVIG